MAKTNTLDGESENPNAGEARDLPSVLADLKETISPGSELLQDVPKVMDFDGISGSKVDVEGDSIQCLDSAIVAMEGSAPAAGVDVGGPKEIASATVSSGGVANSNLEKKNSPWKKNQKV